ncbi:MAG: isoprenylcysteine carboxylmethyltransferase family protein [Azospirillaceae bacterium]
MPAQPAPDASGSTTGDPGDTRTAGVVLHPPVLYGGALIAGLLIDALTPLHIGLGPWRFGPAIALGLAGLALGGAAALRFRRVGTPIPTNRPTSALVVGGAYRWSRNPIYLGLTALYAAIALAADAPVTLALLAPVLVVMHYGVIRREERYLEARFGVAYHRFRGRTRRWL